CLPVICAGAKAIFIDIDLYTQSMSVDCLRREFEKRPIQAVIQPHLFGKATNAEAISALCTEYGATYISDCAQYLGNEKFNLPICQLGMSCFSFGDSKILRIGEGGAIVTNSEML